MVCPKALVAIQGISRNVFGHAVSEIEMAEIILEKINSEKLEKLVKENAVALDIRLDNQWKKTGVIKGSFQETAFDINGKFNVYLMDKIRALAGAESQEIELIFISHDGKTAEILGNAFAEDLGFTNVYVLDGGIQSWIDSNKPLEKYN